MKRAQRRTKGAKRAPSTHASGAKFSPVSVSRAADFPRGGERGFLKEVSSAVREYPAGTCESWGIPFLMPGAGRRAVLLSGSKPTSWFRHPQALINYVHFVGKCVSTWDLRM